MWCSRKDEMEGNLPCTAFLYNLESMSLTPFPLTDASYKVSGNIIVKVLTMSVTLYESFKSSKESVSGHEPL